MCPPTELPGVDVIGDGITKLFVDNKFSVLLFLGDISLDINILENGDEGDFGKSSDRFAASFAARLNASMASVDVNLRDSVGSANRRLTILHDANALVITILPSFFPIPVIRWPLTRTIIRPQCNSGHWYA